jgi:glycosidase
VSVEEEDADPASLLNTYRAALALRAGTPALRDGSYTTIRVNPRPGVIAFWRATETQTLAVFFNIGLKDATVSVATDTAPGLLAETPINLLTGQPEPLDLSALTLPAGAFLLLDYTP